MKSWKQVPLAEVAEINPAWSPDECNHDEEVSFVPMSAVSAETASVTDAETRRLGDVLKGYTTFADRDVLVAKITPCFENGKIAHARLSHRYGFGSTEFHVLRTHPNVLDDRYLLRYLRQDHIRLDGARKMTGSAGQRRVPKHFLDSLPIPLPPLEEQKRIADILDRAEALQASRRAALALLDTLPQAIFTDMFGDPRTNPRRLPVFAMREIFSDPPIFGSMVPPEATQRSWLSLRVGNIQGGKLDLSDSKFIDLPDECVTRHSVRDGDLLLARAIASREHLGKCVVAYPGERRWAFDSHLMRMRFDRTKALPEYIQNLLVTPGGRSLFLGVTRKSTVQYNVNTKEMAGLRIPLPPLPLQQEFARRMAAVEGLRASQRASLATLDELFASLQHRAFRGDL